MCWVFVYVRGLSLVAASGGHSSSWCTGPLTVAASLVAEHRLQRRRLSSCGSRAQLLHGMRDLPRPGLEPVSPALAGRFSTTAPYLPDLASLLPLYPALILIIFCSVISSSLFMMRTLLFFLISFLYSRFSLFSIIPHTLQIWPVVTT